MRTVLVFRERLLEPTETFIVAQAKSLVGYKPILVGLRRIAEPFRHGLPEILLSEGCGTLDKIVAQIFRHAPLAPGFYHKLRSVNPSLLHAHFATDAVLTFPIANALD